MASMLSCRGETPVKAIRAFTISSSKPSPRVMCATWGVARANPSAETSPNTGRFLEVPRASPSRSRLCACEGHRAQARRRACPSRRLARQSPALQRGPSAAVLRTGLTQGAADRRGVDRAGCAPHATPRCGAILLQADQRKASARWSSAARPGSSGFQGLPGWMMETWQLSAASTNWA